MKVKIETYRTFDIEFDTDYEKFQCIVMDGTEKESKSFSAVKKFVDEFWKENNKFKPFKAIHIGWRGEVDLIEIVGIRKDKRFVKKKGLVNQQISEYDEEKYYVLNSATKEILDELQRTKVERNKITKEYDSVIDKLTEQLAPFSIKNHVLKTTP